jgi:hypothetical protein
VRRSGQTKKPSGAEYRRRRRERDEQARREEAERIAAGGAPLPAHLQRYADLELRDDVLGRIEYASAVGVLLLREVVTDPVLDADKRRKQACEVIRSLGMTAVKARYEERIRRIEGTLYGKPFHAGPENDGLEPDPTRTTTSEESKS